MSRFLTMISPEPNTGCWLWTGYVDAPGYGQININRRAVRTHRVSYELHFGPIPNGLFVCHKCDERTCVNPAHLFLGTHRDNMRDMMNKGRGTARSDHPFRTGACKALAIANSPRGEAKARAKLTDAAVLEMRRVAHLFSERYLASMYGVSRGVVRSAVAGRTWSHVP